MGGATKRVVPNASRGLTRQEPRARHLETRRRKIQGEKRASSRLRDTEREEVEEEERNYSSADSRSE